MKLLDQLALRARIARRRAAGRIGLSPLPASICLRLDGFDAPAPVTPALDLAGWEERIIGLALRLGPVPTRVVAHADNPLLPDVARFAGRLECPVTIRTTAAGLDGPRARELIDAGLRRVVVVDAQGSSLRRSEEEPGAAVTAVAALVAARELRQMRFDVVVELPAALLDEHADPEPLAGPLRAAGADGVSVGVPWSSPHPLPLEAFSRWHASFHRTEGAAFDLLARLDGAGPGAARTKGHCPVGARRIELGADGAAYACPFKGGRVPLGVEADLDGLAGHRSEIAACRRECAHPDLA